jgi:glycosyltransferase involved in cell wall biosynthesis
VVLPAYNAEKTLDRTFREIPREIVDDVLLVDDSSSDLTVSLAKRLGIRTFIHDANYGYGRNQKTCSIVSRVTAILPTIVSRAISL